MLQRVYLLAFFVLSGCSSAPPPPPECTGVMYELNADRRREELSLVPAPGQNFVPVATRPVVAKAEQPSALPQRRSVAPALPVVASSSLPASAPVVPVTSNPAKTQQVKIALVQEMKDMKCPKIVPVTREVTVGAFFETNLLRELLKGPLQPQEARLTSAFDRGVTYETSMSSTGAAIFSFSVSPQGKRYPDCPNLVREQLEQTFVLNSITPKPILLLSGAPWTK